MNQIRELICIKTNPKDSWTAFSFPAHCIAVQSLGLAQGEMDPLCSSAALYCLQIFLELLGWYSAFIEGYASYFF